MNIFVFSVVNKVSECAHLRHHLMKKEYLEIFIHFTEVEHDENISSASVSILTKLVSSDLQVSLKFPFSKISSIR